MESSRLERAWGQEIPHLQKGPDKTQLASSTVEIRLISRRLKGSGRGSNLEGWMRKVKEIFVRNWLFVHSFFLEKSKRMKWVGHVARMGKRVVYRILVWKPERKISRDIMHLVASIPQKIFLKLFSKFHCFNVTFLLWKTRKCTCEWRYGLTHSYVWHWNGGVGPSHLSTRLL